MAAIDLSSISAPLNDGILQLQNGVAMSSTLTSVTDQSNTASTLKLSTTSAQFTSPLRITTDDPSDFYLDCEDGSTNNRFSITRNTASQQVNLNFASNPAGSTTIVGAVRTYVDGVNLSEVMTFREDGLLTLANSIEFSNYNRNFANASFPIDNAYIGNLRNVITIRDGGGAGIKFLDSGGSAYAKMGFGNLNTTIGQSTFGVVPDLGARLGVRGSGSTSATTSLLVQNSGGSNALKVRDDGKTAFGNASIDCTITGTAGSGNKFEFYAFNGYDIVDGFGNVLVTGLGSTIRLPRQVGIGFNTQNNASAILQADSTTQGFLPPRMTDAQIRAIATPAEGLIAYNTDISHLCCYQAGAWVKFSHSPM